MNRSKICFILAFVVTLVSADLHAQKKKMPTKQKPKTSQPPTQKKQTPNQKKQVVTTPTVREKPAENQAGEPDKKVRDIVAFFEFMLNTLGSSSTSIRDKEVLVRESYSKVFRDQKVQVEDDLENRNVITNKDVVAYLKDVDFFFTDVKFEFTVDKIEGGGTESNGVFYKVTLHRNLQGKTIDGEEVNNTVQRFIEINDNPEEGLKIVSIYTKGFDEREALTSWWNDLSYEWRSIFKRKVGVSHDSVTLEEIREIIDIDSLDISGNFFIRSMEPLSQLTALSTLNISGTMVEDLSPIRNLTTLRELALANTNIKDLSALKYASGMTRLDLRNVPLANADVIQKMPLLQQLDISGTMISDLTLLAGLTELRRLNASKTRISSIGALSELRAITELDISSTAVTDLATVGKLTGLVTLNIDSTKVADFRPLATATSLKTLYANQTRVENIQPLKGLPALEKVYCDQTPIVAAVANAFMAERPGVLIIYDSKDLLAWWGTLGVSWKKILFGLGADPTKDDLARITNLDSVNLSGNAAIEKLDPLARLPKLKVIIANATAVIDLTPIKDHQELVLLDVSNTDVTDLSPLRRLRKLAEVRANNTRVQNIDPLSELKQLVKIEVDDSGIHDIHAREFLATKPACLLVYKTYHVQRWWQRLSDDWKKVFSQQLKKPDPSTVELHRLVESTSLRVEDVQVSDLSSLAEFIRLEELHISGTAVTDLSPIGEFNWLRSLHVNNSPVRDLEAINGLTGLVDLDISSTPVAELKPLKALTNLRKFNCAGTLVRKLDALEGMPHLEFVDCSNTSVGDLDPLANLPIKTVRCYNSRVSRRDVERLREKGVDVVYYR